MLIRPLALASLLLIGDCIAARAACNEQDFQPNHVLTWQGSIGGTRKIRLSLTLTDRRIAGIYADKTAADDIPLIGTISPDNQLTLERLDAKGRPSEHFEAKFETRDPKGRFTGELRCEVITGNWQQLGAYQRVPVYLALQHSQGGTLANMYAGAGAVDDKAVNQAAARLQKALKDRDKATIISLISWPLTVNVGRSSSKLRSPDQLRSRYNEVFSPALLQAAGAAIPHQLFSRDQGIMLGDGEVWFTPEGKVYALNVPAPARPSSPGAK